MDETEWMRILLKFEKTKLNDSVTPTHFHEIAKLFKMLRDEVKRNEG